VFTVTLRLALETRHWTWLNHLAIWGELAVTVLFTLVYTQLPASVAPNVYGVGVILFRQPQFWLTVLLAPVLILIPDFVFKLYVSQRRRLLCCVLMRV